MTAKYKAETVPIDSLIENPRNDRIHDAEQIAALVKSLATYGQYRDVLVRRENRMLIAGHGIWLAAREMSRPTSTIIDQLVAEGWSREKLRRPAEIAAVFLDVSQVVADEILVVDNRSFELGDTDAQRRAALLAGIEPERYDALGFLPDDIKELLGADGEEDVVVRRVDTSEVADTFWISIRGPLADQAEVLQRLELAMQSLPAVSVDLGTTI